MPEDSTVEIRRGAVLYDDRVADERGLCHVRGVYEETTTGERYFNVEDGTHTTQEWVHEGDLHALFTPAGWSFPTVEKPTYHLTRRCGVYDSTDLMVEANRD